MLVVVGRTGRPHGVRGAISIDVRTDEPDRRFVPGAVLVSSSGRELTIESAVWHSGRLLVTFEGFADRTAVEELRGQELSVDRDDSEAPEDPEEFYDSALIDCQVFAGDEALGRVVEVAHLPSQDLLVVHDEEGAEILVPFISAIVPVVDIAARRIEIDPPPGLLDPEG